MHPEAEKKIYDEIPDVTLLTKAMDHYLKVKHFFKLFNSAKIPIRKAIFQNI